MTKQDLIEKIAKDTKLTKKEVEKVVNAMLETITACLSKAKPEPVILTGFGSFVVAKRKERKGRNPKTGEPLTIPAKKVPRFRPGKSLKAAVK